MVACAKKGCQGEGKWYPLIILAHKSRPDATIDSCVNLRLCDECKAEFKLEDIVTGEWWERICAGFVAIGKRRPTRSLTRLGWATEPPDGYKFPVKQ